MIDPRVKANLVQEKDVGGLGTSMSKFTVLRVGHSALTVRAEHA